MAASANNLTHEEYMGLSLVQRLSSTMKPLPLMLADDIWSLLQCFLNGMPLGYYWKMERKVKSSITDHPIPPIVAHHLTAPCAPNLLSPPVLPTLKKFPSSHHSHLCHPQLKLGYPSILCPQFFFQTNLPWNRHCQILTLSWEYQVLNDILSTKIVNFTALQSEMNDLKCKVNVLTSSFPTQSNLTPNPKSSHQPTSSCNSCALKILSGTAGDWEIPSLTWYICQKMNRMSSWLLNIGYGHMNWQISTHS